MKLFPKGDSPQGEMTNSSQNDMRNDAVVWFEFTTHLLFLFSGTTGCSRETTNSHQAKTRAGKQAAKY